jgi:putative hydrolase of the HAD superfamily
LEDLFWREKSEIAAAQERLLNSLPPFRQDERIRIRAITFDVGGTLIEPWPSVGAVYGGVARELDLGNFEAERLTNQFICGWRERGEFAYSRTEWRQLVEHSFRGLCAVSDDLFDAIYERFARAEAWRLFDDVLPAIEQLRQAKVALGLISNWDERLRPLLNELGLSQFFKTIVVSSEVGAHKPAAEIFPTAAEELGFKPAEILHIGDSRREDVDGASRASFQALQISRGAEVGPDQVSTLLELPRIIAARS